MFPQKTVLVIGAGASHEFGLPLGTQLVAEVANVLDFRWDQASRPVGSGDFHVLQALGRLAKSKGTDRNDFTRACGQLRSGITTFLSIDNYLHSHSDNTPLVEAGKIAIARCILAAEGRSKIQLNAREGDGFSVKKIEDTWMLPFIQMLNANVKRSEINSIFRNLVIICFNYDRCIEHALHELIQISFSVDANTATECMKNLAIVHPYGTVGPLPWQDPNSAVSFGDCERGDLELIADRISLFTEQKNDNVFNEFVDSHMRSAERIMFLGFGYYKQNLDLISRELDNFAAVAGSAKGLSNADNRAVVTDLTARFPIPTMGTRVKPELVDMTCTEMMKSYSRFLAAI